METEQENYPLDDAMISLVVDIRKEMQPFNLQLQGALVLFIRQHHLEGNWTIADNGRELVKIAVPAQEPTP